MFKTCSRRSWHLLGRMSHRSNWRVFWVSLVTAGVALTALGLSTAAIASDRWVVAVPLLRLTTSSSADHFLDGSTTSSGGSCGENDKDQNQRVNSHVNFGLFHGYKCIDNGLGPRYGAIWVHCISLRNMCGWEWSWTEVSLSQQLQQSKEPTSAGVDNYMPIKEVPLRLVHTVEDALRAFDELARLGSDAIPSIDNDDKQIYSSVSDFGLFNCGLWASTVTFVGLCILAGVIVFVLLFLNLSLASVHGEVICPAWIFVWMGASELSTVMAVFTYAVLYGTDYRNNILTKEDRELYKWITNSSTTSLDISYYLLIASAVLHFVNIFIYCITLSDCSKQPASTNTESDSDAVVLMY